MKFSRFRGKDVWNMALKLGVFVLVLAALLGAGIYFGGKYAAPKVTAFLDEVKGKISDAQGKDENAGGSMGVEPDAADVPEDTESGEGSSQAEESREDGSQEAGGEGGAQAGESGEDGSQDAEGESAAVQVGDAAIHRYQYVVEDCSWPEAADRCREKGGYLAVINSQEEYDHIIQELESNHLEKTMFFLGASRGEGSEYYWMDTDGEFTGEPLNGAGQWMQGEPSFQDGEVQETVMAMFRYEEEGRWVWNDIPSNILENFSYYSGKIGYICEFPE